MHQDLLTALFNALMGGPLSYAINQLPPLKQSRGRWILLVLLAIGLPLLGWILRVPSTEARLYKAYQAYFDGSKPVVLGVVVLSLLGLMGGWLGKEMPQNSVPQPNLRDRLLQAELEEVAKRKDDSLHHQILIDLNLTDKREQVGRPSKQLITNETIDLPATTQIIDVFRRSDVGGRLLLLGDPGAGKTTMLLELAKSLLESGQQDPTAPVPVILELSTWREDQKPLADWLVEQLWQKYKLDRTISRDWLESGQILPLLDGLDELGLDRQRKAMTAINQYLNADAKLDLVVCCRQEEYQESQSQLTQLKGAICLQPLTEAQIQVYLTQLEKVDLWQHIQSNSELLELSRLPLLLHIMAIVYQGQPIQNRQALFDAYVIRRFELPLQKLIYDGKEPNQAQTHRYLVWLAKQMQTQNETEFLIERLQPSSLVTWKQKWTYRLIGTLIGTLIGALMGGLIGALMGGLIFGLIFGLMGGLIFGLNFMLNDIVLVEAVQISITHLSKKETLQKLCSKLSDGWVDELILVLNFGLIGGLIFGLIDGLIDWLNFGLIDGLKVGLMYRLVDGLKVGLIGGLMYRLIFRLIDGLKVDLQTRLLPKEGIKASARNAGILMALILSIFLLIWVFLNSFIQSALGRDANGIFRSCWTFTLSTSFFCGGGFACAQHFALRIVLWQSKIAPWNYAKFLDYASDRRLIQQVGGRYRFIHRLLRDQFAAMELR